MSDTMFEAIITQLDNTTPCDNPACDTPASILIRYACGSDIDLMCQACFEYYAEHVGDTITRSGMLVHKPCGAELHTVHDTMGHIMPESLDGSTLE